MCVMVSRVEYEEISGDLNQNSVRLDTATGHVDSQDPTPERSENSMTPAEPPTPRSINTSLDGNQQESHLVGL